MKKTVLFAMILGLAASSALAAHKNQPDAAKPAPSDSPWIVGIGPLVAAPMNDINTSYHAAFGGKIYLGYALSRDWRVQLDLDNVYYSNNPLSDYELRILPCLKYMVGRGDLRPYLMAGMGVDMQFVSASGQTATGTSLEESVGLGAQYRLSQQTFVFVEGKYSFTFSTGVMGEDLPVIAGLEFGI